MSEPKEIYGVWGVIREPETEKILLVANRRRNATLDWSLPGGLVDEGESFPDALTREFEEETGLKVDDWSRLLYTNEIKFRNRPKGREDFNFNIKVYLGSRWSGILNFNDPDQIVEYGVFAEKYLVRYLLKDRSEYMVEPLMKWLEEPWENEVQYFSYMVSGAGSKEKVRRIRHP